MFCCISGCLLFLICIEFVFSCTVLFVSISQVIDCEDSLRIMTYIVSSEALNSTPTKSNHRLQRHRGHVPGNIWSAGDEVSYIPGKVCQVSAVACQTAWQLTSSARCDASINANRDTKTVSVNHNCLRFLHELTFKPSSAQTIFAQTSQEGLANYVFVF